MSFGSPPLFNKRMLEDPTMGGFHTSNHSSSDIKTTTAMHIMPQGHFTLSYLFHQNCHEDWRIGQWAKGLLYGMSIRN